MQTVSMRMPAYFKQLLYAVLSLSWFTGITFFIFSNWITVNGDFGPEKHPLQFSFLQLHGAAAFVLMPMMGAIIFNHIPITWRTKRSRKIGIILLVLLLAQLVSAWLLYYLAHEVARQWATYIHLAIGLSLPVFIAAHVLLGRRRAVKQIRSSLITDL